MRHERLLFEEAYGTSGIGLWKYDVAAQRLFWCRETRALLAQDSFEGSLEDFTRGLNDDDAQGLSRALFEALAQHDQLEVELRTASSDAQRHLLLRGRVHRAADRRAIKATGTLVDISRIKQAEEQLRQTLQARDEFLSIASHELNTPLTVLQLNLQNLQRKLAKTSGETVDLAVIHKHLDPMVRQVGRLASLLSNLLDVSRVETGRLHLSLEAFDLCDTLQEMAARFMPLANEQHTELVLKPCQPLIGYWDRLRIEQVLSNLIANAIKYGQGNPVTLSLCRRGECAAVMVQDRGIGVSQDQLPRIFNRFERATDLRKRESFGLGLYISSQIARAHGGYIEVESCLGEGSTFTLSLPVHRTQPPPLEQA